MLKFAENFSTRAKNQYLDVRRLRLFKFPYVGVAESNTELTFLHNPLGKKWVLINSILVLCDAAWPMMDSFNTPDHVGDLELESKIFSVVTGIKTDTQDLHQYGERIFNQQRAVLLREGWRAKTDDYTAEFNFTQPIYTDALNPDLIVPGPEDESVSVKGALLDKEKYR